MLKIQFLPLLAFYFLSSGAMAQVVGQNLAFLPEYQEQLPYFQELITGGKYEEPSSLIQGDPYYLTRQFESGSLTINEITYPGVPLLYDIFRDQILTFHPLFNQKILIKPGKVDRFVMGDGSAFARLEGNDSFGKAGSGFYKVIAEGDFWAISKPYKTSKSLREMSRYDEVYVEKEVFFLWKGGTFFPISKGKQAISLLGLNKAEAKQKLRAEQLNFKQNPEGYLRLLVNLTPSQP
ncbi:hypothetical protein [Algoriphagus taiwanensis]